MGITDRVTSQSQIPNTEYYVLCNDKDTTRFFRLGLNHRINTLIFPCDNYNEAKKVYEYADNRHSQTYVRIVRNKPRLNHKTHVYQLKSKQSYPRWYSIKD